MLDTPVWMVTGAGRGMGTDIARAAVAAGHRVVASGRDPVAVREAVGDGDAVLAVELDVTRQDQVDAAVAAALAAFGRIDVLVNNAGNSYKGFFEDLTIDQIDAQIRTNVYGPMRVAQAVLPVMRRQGTGLVLSISSGAGQRGVEFASAYATSKFALEGWMESLAPEVALFGIKAVIVEPGYFRTELRGPRSTTYAEGRVEDYADRRAAQLRWWAEQDRTAGGDPARLAEALLALAAMDEPPLRFMVGTGAIEMAESKVAALQQDLAASRRLSVRLAFGEV